VKHHRPQKRRHEAIPIVKYLPCDPEWEVAEAKLTDYCNRQVAPFEE
jgi:hypothetical protein